MRLTLGIQKMNSAICKPLATSAFRSLASIGPLAAILILGAGLLAPHPLAAQRPERPTLEITGYVIDAEIDTSHSSPRRQGHRHLQSARKLRDGQLRFPSRFEGQ